MPGRHVRGGSMHQAGMEQQHRAGGALGRSAQAGARPRGLASALGQHG
jgi:hypothetical protein